MQEYPFVEYTYSMIAEKNPDGPLEKKSGAVNSNTGFFSWRHPRTINRPSATNSRITRIFCTFAITSTPHRLMAKNTLRAAIPNHFALTCGHREFAYQRIKSSSKFQCRCDPWNWCNHHKSPDTCSYICQPC